MTIKPWNVCSRYCFSGNLICRFWKSKRLWKILPNITRLEDAGIDLCMKIPGVVFRGIYKLLFYVILPYGIVATFPTMYLSGDGTLKMWLYGIAVVTVFGGITAFLWKTGLKRYNSVSS